LKKNVFCSGRVVAVLLLCVFSGLVFAGENEKTIISATVKLSGESWYSEVKSSLEQIITDNAGKNKKAVFDCDNTILCRDIGEATLAVMVMEGRLTPQNVPSEVSPEFIINGKKINLKSGLMTYYDDILSATAHHKDEKCPSANSYAWAVQIMNGMTPAEIIPFTEKAYADGLGQKDMNDKNLKRTQISGVDRPFIYPEMADLLGTLIKNKIGVYVISASNVWSVRWLVINKLNPMLKEKFGNDVFLQPDHVIGISVLLRDKRDGRLYKDPLLVKTNKKYAEMDMDELNNYELTTQIAYPLSGYYGKVANVLKFVTFDRPLLAGGDSSNDFPMLNFAENRLFITRLDKLNYQKELMDVVKDSLPGKWLLQPSLNKIIPGFVSSDVELNKRLEKAGNDLKTAGETVGFLKKSGQWKSF